jgi:hypothetical protein
MLGTTMLKTIPRKEILAEAKYTKGTLVRAKQYKNTHKYMPNLYYIGSVEVGRDTGKIIYRIFDIPTHVSVTWVYEDEFLDEFSIVINYNKVWFELNV